MTDALGWRHKFGVVAPSTNTIVQPDYDDMRPDGVTNHFSRALIPNLAVSDDQSFLAMIERIRDALEPALDGVLTCEPDSIILGVSGETFWDGKTGAAAMRERFAERALGRGVVMGSEACIAALERYPEVRRLAVITPYMPSGDAQVRGFFEDWGYEVVRLRGLKCGGPVVIAHVGADELGAAVDELDGEDVDAIVQCGTNLSMVKVAAEKERQLGKPVIAINTATYWYALRQNGIEDRLDGFGSLPRDH